MLNCVLFLCSVCAISAVSVPNSYCDLKCQNGKQVYTHTVCQRTKESETISLILKRDFKKNVAYFHQKCGPHPRCGSEFKVIKLEDKMKGFVVALHNNLRNKVASGNESRGPQPAASNMRVMKYDLELEYIAQCWANSCNASPLKHDKCRNTKKYEHVGQNLAYVKSTAPNIGLKYGLETMIMHWYDEVTIFDNGWIKDTQPRGPVKIGHYTQMVWANTNQIGCGLSFYTKVNKKTSRKWYHYFLVCNYGPGGNYIGQPVYEEGPSCKACGNKSCNKIYNALCD